MWAELKTPKLGFDMNSKLRLIESRCELANSVYGVDGIRKYYDYMDIKHTQNTLLAENTKVSYDETVAIMNESIPEGIGSREYNECASICQAVKYAHKCIEEGVPFDINLLMELHSIVGSRLLQPKHCGHPRDCRVLIGRGFYGTAQINQINKLLNQLFSKLEDVSNPIVKAAWFSYNLVATHPFVDFNGRISRLCEIYILMQSGYPVISLSESNIPEYMELIRLGCENTDKENIPYINFIADRVNERLDEMLN